MPFDAHSNFPYSTVAVISDPDTATDLDVQAGDTAVFPTPPFNVTVWAAGERPLASNATILRVTGIAGDTFTFARTQEGSSDRSILVGDQIAATITKKTLTDLELSAASYSTIDYEGDADLTFGPLPQREVLVVGSGLRAFDDDPNTQLDLDFQAVRDDGPGNATALSITGTGWAGVGGAATPKIHIDRQRVWLQGVIEYSGLAATASVGVATIPTGFRPARETILPAFWEIAVPASSPPSAASVPVMNILVEPGGGLSIECQGANPSPPPNTRITLDLATWRIVN